MVVTEVAVLPRLNRVVVDADDVVTRAVETKLVADVVAKEVVPGLTEGVAPAITGNGRSGTRTRRVGFKTVVLI